MPIQVTCECGQQFQTRDENAGRRAMCPDCGREMVVPRPGAVQDDIFVLPAESQEPVTSGKATSSLTLGFLFFCGVFTGIPAIVLGCLALGEIGRSRGRLKGRGTALAGIALGVFSTLLTVAILLPAVRSSRETARRSQCVNNLKQIGLAMYNYHSTYNCFPAAATTDTRGQPLLSWRVAILPFLEQSPLYAKFHLDEPWNSPHNLTLLDEMPGVYACPSDPESRSGGTKRQHGGTNYDVIIDPRSMFPPDFKPVTIAGVTDGISSTLLVGETKQGRPWTAPFDVPFNTATPQSGLDSFHSHHSGGFNALIADGSVKFLKASINPVIFRAIVTRDGGEVIGSDGF